MALAGWRFVRHTGVLNAVRMGQVGFPRLEWNYQGKERRSEGPVTGW